MAKQQKPATSWAIARGLAGGERIQGADAAFTLYDVEARLAFGLWLWGMHVSGGRAGFTSRVSPPAFFKTPKPMWGKDFQGHLASLSTMDSDSPPGAPADCLTFVRLGHSPSLIYIGRSPEGGGAGVYRVLLVSDEAEESEDCVPRKRASGR